MIFILFTIILYKKRYCKFINKQQHESDLHSMLNILAHIQLLNIISKLLRFIYQCFHWSPSQWSSKIYYHIGTGIRTLTVFILIHKDKNIHVLRIEINEIQNCLYNTLNPKWLNSSSFKMRQTQNELILECMSTADG